MDRVQKLIAHAGVCSRRKAEELIEKGKVTVNGKEITIGDKADWNDKIVVDGRPLKKPEFVYYMLNKPRGFISTTDDMYERKIVTSLLPNRPKIYPVGRLDRDTTGLLLLTNDGDFANKIMHPSNGVSKTYIAYLDKPFTHEAQLAQGIKVENITVYPKIISIENDMVTLSVHVGVNKVVKRIFKELGYYVRRLHRSHIGNLFADVPIGKFRKLNPEDFAALKK